MFLGNLQQYFFERYAKDMREALHLFFDVNFTITWKFLE